MNKVIYFDKETINNILQELNKGEKSIENIDSKSSVNKINGDIELNTGINLGVPFLKRLRFVFSGELSSEYVRIKDNKTSVTSTELSEFDKIKNRLQEFKNIRIEDIMNSSTYFRVASHYIQIMKDGVEDLDSQKLKDVMENFDGYDMYKIGSIPNDTYIRFNNTSFLSNYKRNELLLTEMDVSCIYIGKFKKEKFDFLKQIEQMEKLGEEDVNKRNTDKVLGEKYSNIDNTFEEEIGKERVDTGREIANTINLYDVVYACVANAKKSDIDDK